MPSMHSYKCLNPNCKDAHYDWFNTFNAMNSPLPQCPTCSGIKLEDRGVYIPSSVMISGAQSHENTKNTDANLRRTAERYGLTDMNNKDGQAVKRAAPPARMDSPLAGQHVKVGGYDLPFGAGCHNIPSAAQKIPTASVPVKASSSAMMNKMTRVVGEHKA